MTWALLVLLLLITCPIASGDVPTTADNASENGGTEKRGRRLSPVLAPLKSPEKLSFFYDILRNGIDDPASLIASAVESDAMKMIYDNVEIQHRILEASPLLRAVEGFKSAAGRRLADDQTVEAFKQGVTNLLELSKNAENIVKDPSASVRVLNDLMESGDNQTKDLILAARGGDVDATKRVKRLVGKELFPGVDMDLMDEACATANFDHILNSPEMMHYIDQDSYMSQAIRKGIPLASNIKGGSDGGGSRGRKRTKRQ